MEHDRLDCSWCGSARSIEYGICQVCLMEYPHETKIIPLPIERAVASRRVIDLTESEIGLAE